MRVRGVMRAVVVVLGLALLALGHSPHVAVAGDGGGSGSGSRAIVAVHQDLITTNLVRPVSTTDPNVPLSVAARAQNSFDINLNPEFAYHFRTTSSEGYHDILPEHTVVGDKAYIQASNGDWFETPANALIPFRSPWQRFVPDSLDDEPALRTLRDAGVTVVSLDDEQIHGVATHHTRIELRDARMAVTFFKSVPPSLDLIYETASYRSLSSLSDSNMDDLSDTSDTSGMDDGYVDFELWSGVSDHFPHRVTITVGGSRERIEITSDQTPFYERFPIVIPENVQVYEGR